MPLKENPSFSLWVCLKKTAFRRVLCNLRGHVMAFQPMGCEQ